MMGMIRYTLNAQLVDTHPITTHALLLCAQVAVVSRSSCYHSSIVHRHSGAHAEGGGVIEAAAKRQHPAVRPRRCSTLRVVAATCRVRVVPRAIPAWQVHVIVRALADAHPVIAYQSGIMADSSDGVVCINMPALVSERYLRMWSGACLGKAFGKVTGKPWALGFSSAAHSRPTVSSPCGGRVQMCDLQLPSHTHRRTSSL